MKIAEVCYAMIVAVARLPRRLLVRGSMLMPQRPAPLLSDGASDSEELEFEPTSSEDEANFIVTRPNMEDATLQRYGAVLDRQGGVFNGVPLKNRGGGDCHFLSLAHGARGLCLLADATSASSRKTTTEFTANESARKIGATALERKIHGQFSLSVLDYAEEMAKGGVWGGFTEIAEFALKSGCVVEVYEKSNGNFKQLLEFGQKGARCPANLLHRRRPLQAPGGCKRHRGRGPKTVTWPPGSQPR